MNQNILSLRHVYVSRGGPPVLHDINLDLHAGEHLAILGPNGCGKSTLLKTITCELYPLAHPPGVGHLSHSQTGLGESEGHKPEAADSDVPEAGGSRTSVSIFGRERWDVTELRRRLGVVSPDLPGRATLETSGLDTILTGFFSSSTLWPNLAVTEEMRARAEDLLHQVGAEDLRDTLVGAMSAGQQRRIMIARALAGSRAAARAITPTHPAIIPADTQRSGEPLPSAPVSDSESWLPSTGEMLLLDEPSNALDLAAQQDLRNLLRRLAQSGTTILLITHHIADIIPEIDRILLMSKGRITADGPKQNLLKPETLSKLFNTAVDLTERDGFFHAW